MLDKNHEIWIEIDPDAFKEFARTVKRVNETNIFPTIMLEENFSKIDNNTYQKGNDQLIKVFLANEKWQYQNLKNPQDFGSAIQFIANRWATETPLLQTEPGIIFGSAVVAHEYYQSHVKALKKEYQLKLLQNPPPAKTNRIRK